MEESPMPESVDILAEPQKGPALDREIHIQTMSRVIEGIHELIQSCATTAEEGFDDQVIARVRVGVQRRLDSYSEQLGRVPNTESRVICESLISDVASRLDEFDFSDEWATSEKAKLRIASNEVDEARRLVESAKRRRLAAQRAEALRQSQLRQPLEFNIGAVGIMPSFRVDQVLDDYSTLITVESSDTSAILRGFPTSNFVDDKYYTIEAPMSVVGTERYRTVTGASRQVFTIQPISE